MTQADEPASEAASKSRVNDEDWFTNDGIAAKDRNTGCAAAAHAPRAEVRDWCDLVAVPATHACAFGELIV
jgi:hypothetical protein